MTILIHRIKKGDNPRSGDETTGLTPREIWYCLGWEVARRVFFKRQFVHSSCGSPTQMKLKFGI